MDVTGLGAKCDFSAVYDLTGMSEQCRSLHLDCSDWNISPNTLHSDSNKNVPGVILPKAWQLPRCRSGKTKTDSRDNPTLSSFLFTLSEGSVAYACSGAEPPGGGYLLEVSASEAKESSSTS